MDRGGYISYVAKGEEEEVGVDSIPLEHLSTVQWIQVSFVTWTCPKFSGFRSAEIWYCPEFSGFRSAL